MDGTVLVADDDRTIRTVLTQALTRAGCKVHATGSLVTLMRWVEEGKGELVITDVQMPDGNGLDGLPRISAMRPQLPVIVISAQNNILTAIQATENDAFDYLPKPFDLPDLMKRCARALDRKTRRSPDENEQETAQDDLPLVGRTSAMQTLYRTVARVMNVDLAVLIIGESGTGKSLIARAIHDFSDRRARPFVVASISDFATPEAADALIAHAGNGSLLIEDVSDLDDTAQARLVRRLDRFDQDAPRILATSQRALEPMVQTEEMRADLFYRLGGISIAVPPLRDRIKDVSLLVDHFTNRALRDGLAHRRFDDQALAFACNFSWPGNVRQLENAIRQLAVISSAPMITVAELSATLGSQPNLSPTQSDAADKLGDSVAKHLRRYFDLHGKMLPPAGLYPRILREVEAPLLEIALDATGGNQAKCADLLGINRNTLRKKLTELDISVTRRRKLM